VFGDIVPNSGSFWLRELYPISDGQGLPSFSLLMFFGNISAIRQFDFSSKLKLISVFESQKLELYRVCNESYM
jgi:hypothetical protein